MPILYLSKVLTYLLEAQVAAVNSSRVKSKTCPLDALSNVSSLVTARLEKRACSSHTPQTVFQANMYPQCKFLCQFYMIDCTGVFFEEWNEITPQTRIRKFEEQTT